MKAFSGPLLERSDDAVTRIIKDARKERRLLKSPSKEDLQTILRRKFKTDSMLDAPDASDAW